MSDTMVVRLRLQDADALLAAAEAAINEGLPLGPGLHRWNVVDAARQIESVAALFRQGVASDGTSPDIPAIRRVLAAHRSEDALVKAADVQAAWAEFEATREALADRDEFERLLAECRVARNTLAAEVARLGGHRG